MGDGMLSLSWNNHKATFCHILTTLREKERFTDATVACEGRFYQVHKLVLSTCSEYFEKMFDNTPCKHPVIVLKDIASDELEALLSYMYDGVVSVAQNDLARLIKAAEVLRIKGLAVPDEPPPPPPQRNDVSRRSAQSRNASDDRSSPHPKRRRRDENIPSQSIGHSSPISSPRASPALSDVDLSRTQTDTRWSEHSEDKNIDRSIDDRLRPSATSSGSHQSGEVLVDETLVKEEIDDSADNRDDLLDSGMDYGSLGSDSRLDGSLGGDGENSSSQIGPTKFEKSGSHSQAQNQQLPEAVVEALAGPSGMQGWLGGCEAPGGGFSGMEGYSGEGSSQDMHPPQQGPPGVQSQAHQMMEQHREGPGNSGIWNQPTALTEGVWSPFHPGQEDNTVSIHGAKSVRDVVIGRTLISCQYCDYKSTNRSLVKAHLLKHTGERPFSCPYCQYRSSDRTCLKNHIRRHTGEKPFQCPHCSYRAAGRSTLNYHLSTH